MIRLIAATAIVVLITGIVIRIFFIDSFTVIGDSMAPTLVDGDYVFVNKHIYTRIMPQRGDIVVGNFRSIEPKIIKRVVGLPGEWVFIKENGMIGVAAERDSALEEVPLRNPDSVAMKTEEDSGNFTYRLDPHEYFLVGDNFRVSKDSRELGPIDAYKIDGKVFLRIRVRELSYEIFH